MALGHLGLLVSISAIWGSAFMFYAYLTPLFGVFLTAGGRLLVAGLALVLLFTLQKRDLMFRSSWKVYMVIGVLNSALPFVLYSWASRYIPSSVEVVLNALTPAFGAVFSFFLLRERLSLQKGAGILLGFLGVCLIAGLGPFALDALTLLACLACIAATASYALAAIYLKRRASHLSSRQNAAGSQLLGGLLLLPFVPIDPPQASVSLVAVGVLILFALLCSAVAYLLYYRLVEVAGPTTALSVTYPMPIFGFLWGCLLLGETLTWGMLGGTALVLLGMYWLTKASKPRAG